MKGWMMGPGPLYNWMWKVPTSRIIVRAVFEASAPGTIKSVFYYWEKINHSDSCTCFWFPSVFLFCFLNQVNISLCNLVAIVFLSKLFVHLSALNTAPHEMYQSIKLIWATKQMYLWFVLCVEREVVGTWGIRKTRARQARNNKAWKGHNT